MTCCKENVESMLGSEMPSNSLLETSGKRKKKFTGGNASKRHRDRVNIEFSNLAKLLPFSESVIAKLDKSSILRLAVSFIRAKSFFKDAERAFEKRINVSGNNIKKEEPSPPLPIPPPRLKEGTGILAEIFSQALDGFLLVLTEDMKVLFVSESVRDYLGYCQAGIIHENFLQFVNPSDHAAVQASLMYRKNEIETTKSHTPHQQGYHDRHGFTADHVANCFDNGFKRCNVARRFVCRMKCAFSCSSRFYTAYRTFQFSGHLRRSTIQEGREQKHLNSLVVFAVPIPPHSSSTCVEPVNDMMERTTTSLRSPGSSMESNDFSSYYERFGSGFRIEPTLRPHIAPIPVSRTDHPEHQPSGTMTRVRSCSLSEMPPLDVRQREYIYISRDSQPCITKTYSGPCSNESRYSDYSDDSKCSPASSPNLLWKNRPPSPYVPQFYNKNEITEQYNRKVEEFCRGRERNMRRSLTEKEYSAIKLRASPDAYENKLNTEFIKSETPWYADFRHACSNVYDEYKNTSQYQPNFNPYTTMERTDRKRNIMSDKDSNPHVCNVPAKRKKTQNGSKRYDFNISSLLGLDQKEASVMRTHKPTRDEEVDVCNIDEGGDLQTYKEILANVPSNLELSHTRTPAILPQC